MKGSRLLLLSLTTILLLSFCGCAAHHPVAQTDVEGFVEIDGQVKEAIMFAFHMNIIKALVNFVVLCLMAGCAGQMAFMRPPPWGA